MTPDELIFKLVDLFDQLQVRYAIVGSVASMSFGEPRFTNDVDIVADLREEHAEAIVAAFPGPDFYCSLQAVKSAIAKRFQFNIIHSTEGVKADIIVATNGEFDQLQLSRRIWMKVGTAGEAWVASPEDVILKKLEYYQLGRSPKHVRDIASMLRINQRPLDMAYIEHWVAKLNVQDVWQEILSVANS